ncbi:hypothetical protein [Candidatus Vidania fulgoroideorum]
MKANINNLNIYKKISISYSKLIEILTLNGFEIFHNLGYFKVKIPYILNSYYSVFDFNNSLDFLNNIKNREICFKRIQKRHTFFCKSKKFVFLLRNWSLILVKMFLYFILKNFNIKLYIKKLNYYCCFYIKTTIIIQFVVFIRYITYLINHCFFCRIWFSLQKINMVFVKKTIFIKKTLLNKLEITYKNLDDKYLISVGLKFYIYFKNNSFFTNGCFIEYLNQISGLSFNLRKKINKGVNYRDLEKELSDILINLGFRRIFTNSLCNIKSNIKILNPISDKFLRERLSDNVFKFNYKNEEEFFEISNVFKFSKNKFKQYKNIIISYPTKKKIVNFIKKISFILNKLITKGRLVYYKKKKIGNIGLNSKFYFIEFNIKKHMIRNFVKKMFFYKIKKTFFFFIGSFDYAKSILNGISNIKFGLKKYSRKNKLLIIEIDIYYRKKLEYFLLFKEIKRLLA